MAEFSNPTGKVTDDVWAAAKFAVANENEKTGSTYELEDVLWYLPKTEGGHYIMVIQVTGDMPSNMFGVIVREDADTGEMNLEQFNSIFKSMA